MKEILCLIHAILAKLVLHSIPGSDFSRDKLEELGQKIEDFSEENNLSKTEKEFIENLREFCTDIKRES